MAFQNVNQAASGEAVKLTGMAVGSSITGYVIGFRESKQNPDNQNILMRSENGNETFYVYTAGNVKYLVKDGKIKIGLLTRITRIADKNVKGKTSSQFTVEQDPTQTAEDLSFASLAPSSNDKNERAEAITSSVRKQAEKLASSMSAKRG